MATPSPTLTYCLPPGVCQVDATSSPATAQPHQHAPATTYAVLSFTLTEQRLQAASRHSHSVHSQQHADQTTTSISWWGADRHDSLTADGPLQYSIVIPVDRFLQYLLDTPQHQLQLSVRSSHNSSTVAEGAVDLTDLIHHLGTSSVAPQFTATQTYAVTNARNRSKYGDVTIRTDFQLTSNAVLATPARAPSQASSASLRGVAERANRLKQQLQQARELEVERQRAEHTTKAAANKGSNQPPMLYPMSPLPHHHEQYHHSHQKQHLSPVHQPLRMRTDSANSIKSRQRSPLKPSSVASPPHSSLIPTSLDTLSVICLRLRSVTYHNDSHGQQLSIKLFTDETITFQLPSATSELTPLTSHEWHHVYRVSNHRLVQQLATSKAAVTLADTTASSTISLQPLSQLLQQQLQTPLKSADVQQLTIAQVQQRCTVADEVTVELIDASGIHVATCVLSLSIGSEDEITQLDELEGAARTLQKHARRKSIAATAERKGSVVANIQASAAATQTPVKKLKSPEHKQHKSPAASPIPATIKSPKSRAVKPVKPIAVDLQRSASIETQQGKSTLHRDKQSSYIAPTVRQTTDTERRHETQPAVDDEPLPDFRQSSPDLLKAKKKQQATDDAPDGSQSHRPSTAKSVVSRPRTSTSVPRRATLSSGHVRRISIAPRSQTAAQPLSQMLSSQQPQTHIHHNHADAKQAQHAINSPHETSTQQTQFTPAHADDTDLTIASNFDNNHNVQHDMHQHHPHAAASHQPAAAPPSSQPVPAVTATAAHATSLTPPASSTQSTEAILSAISMLQATVVATMAMAYNASQQQHPVVASADNAINAATAAAADLQTPQRPTGKATKDIATSPIDSLLNSKGPPTATNARDVYITIESAKGASIDLSICEDVLADAAKLQQQDKSIKSIHVPSAGVKQTPVGTMHQQSPAPSSQPVAAQSTAAPTAEHALGHNAVNVSSSSVVPSSSSVTTPSSHAIDESRIAPAHRRDDRSASVERKDSQARVNKILSGSRLPPRPPTSNKTADYVAAAPAASYNDEIPLEDRIRRQQARRIAASGMSAGEDPDLERMQRIARILKAKII